MSPSASKKQRILITGGAGFIGARLAERLLRDGHRLAVLTRNTARPNVEQLRAKGAEIVEGNVADWDSLATYGRGEPFDAVLHFAADLNLRGEAMTRTNVAGTRNVLRLAEEAGAQYFVFASSIEAQGLADTHEAPLTEEGPCRPASDYGQAKLEGENLAQHFAKRTGTPALIARIGNTYGVGGYGFVQPFLRAMFTGDPLTAALPVVSGRLLQPIYVDDLVEALARAFAARLSGMYNFTGQQPVAAGEWFIALGELLGVEELARLRLAGSGADGLEQARRIPEVAYFLLGEGERVHRAYSDTKLRAAIGDYQRYNLYRGLAATLAWFESVNALPV